MLKTQLPTEEAAIVPKSLIMTFKSFYGVKTPPC